MVLLTKRNTIQKTVRISEPIFGWFSKWPIDFSLESLQKRVAHVYFDNKAKVFRSQTRTLRSSDPVTNSWGFLFTFKHLMGFWCPLNVWTLAFPIVCQSWASPSFGITTTCCAEGVGAICRIGIPQLTPK